MNAFGTCQLCVGHPSQVILGQPAVQRVPPGFLVAGVDLWSTFSTGLLLSRPLASSGGLRGTAQRCWRCWSWPDPRPHSAVFRLGFSEANLKKGTPQKETHSYLTHTDGSYSEAGGWFTSFTGPDPSQVVQDFVHPHQTN